MNDSAAVKVESLGKRFKIYRTPWGRAREWLTFGTRTYHKDFWALKDISFELKRGESLGIIGPNGAGKSTLLKILTGALYPSEGEYHINGRVLSLLELGTGFNPELTGRQNVFYSAQLLGFPETYLEERLPDIEAFAELGDFFDRPLKLYSSGMHARLGFSLFAFLDCDVLIIDEVLAVGDIFFRQKCYARLEELISQNTAIILVTHSMAVVQQYCQEAVVLNRGRVVFQGIPSEAIKRYFLLNQKPAVPMLLSKPLVMDNDAVAKLDSGDESVTATTPFWPPPEAFLDLSKATSVGEGWARCIGVALCDEGGNPCQVFKQGQQAYFYYEFEMLKDIEVPIGGLTISNDKNILVHGKNTIQYKSEVPLQVKRGMRVRFRQSIALEIAVGEYTFSVGLGTMNVTDYSNIACMSHREMIAKVFRLNHIDRAGTFSVTFRHGDDLPLLHHGLCNLPGECEVLVDGDVASPVKPAEVPMH